MSEAGGTIRIGDLANPVLTPALEAVIADHRWPLPRYREILFHS